MKITLHGAAGVVTGSAYLVETDRARVLVDFGMFQGGRTEEYNVVPAGLQPAQLNAVLVTHAHLDHTGRLPLLVRDGYPGNFFATEPSIELAGLILRDSAKVQAYDVERINRKRQRSGKPAVQPLYTAAEVEAALQRFRPVPFNQPIEIAEGIVARYSPAGHMLGSASIQLTVQENGRQKIVVFSGDIGPAGLAIIPDSVPFQSADLVFLESTYGDRDHKPMAETLADFRGIVESAVQRKARILVPAFAVGRTQQILYHLDEMFCFGGIKSFPVYLDSPMAIEATQIYYHHPDLHDMEAQELARVCDISRQHRHVVPTPTAQDSMKLNDAPGPCLIMAGSGMCNAGRILHHLRHGLWQPETTVLIVGYQAEGTLGRLLVERAEKVKIFGEEIPVRAQVRTLNGFSAHAGQSDLLKWFAAVSAARPRVVLTHGEARGREPLAQLIRERHGLETLLPELGDVVEL